MAAIGPGAIVIVRGRVWTVVDRAVHADCESVRVRDHAASGRSDTRTLLTPFDRLRHVVERTTCRRIRPRRWLHAIRRAALDVHPFGALRAASLSGIDLLSYQLEPALAVFRHGVTRLLVADAVGLGKTIQAGLILRELAVRQDDLRALIVVPAALRDQWRQELVARFGLDSMNADAAWLRSTARTLPPDVNPWSLPGVYVTSFDFLKRAEALRPLEDTIWDAVVVDEAHAAAPGTDRRAAVDAVASRSGLVVLLTATPHSGDSRQFESLCRIGSPSTDPPILMFQRSREDAGREPRRRTVLLPVRLSAAERRMHRLLERYAARIRRDAKARGDAQAALAAVVLRKRALSGAAALLLTASRRQALLSGCDQPSERQLPLPLADEDPLDDALPDDVLAARGLDDAAAEQRALAAIVRSARRAARTESKMTLLLRLLRRVHEPVIVFTEYRDTLAVIEQALRRAAHDPLTLHGGLSPADRAATQRAFNDAGSLLIATDAASEGLNLHLRCRIVVHFELPWTPLRLQQRTGRVDRIGQSKPVHEILLVASDTAEGLVLAPLVKRSSTARTATPGSAALLSSMTESRVAAAILDGHTLADSAAPPAPAVSRVFTPAPAELRSEAEAESARLARHRGYRMQSVPAPPGGHERGPVICRLRRPCQAWLAGGGAVLVFRISLLSAARRVVHSELVALRFELRPGAANLESLERTARLQLAPRLRRTHDDVSRLHAVFVESVRRRELTMASMLPGAGRRLVQAGLFDRRSVRESDARSRSGASLSAQLGDRLRNLDTRSRLTATLDLAAILLGGDSVRAS